MHCDWRYDAVDTALFGSPALGEPDFDFGIAGFSATLELDEGLWQAPAQGFDEPSASRVQPASAATARRSRAA